MGEEIFKNIKNTISVITLLQKKEQVFRKELEFFKQQWKIEYKENNANLYLGAFKRLEDEVGHLCVDVFSLHQGISKKKSLYSQTIKNSGNILSKVDKIPSDPDSYIFVGIAMPDGSIEEFTEQDKKYAIQQAEREHIKSKKELRDRKGITSSKHKDLDQWLDKILDNEIITELAEYRKYYAHRLDSFDNLQRELEFKQPQDIEKMLDNVSAVLVAYKKCLQNILSYTRSEYYLGRNGIRYISLSHLMLAKRVLRKKQRKRYSI